MNKVRTVLTIARHIGVNNGLFGIIRWQRDVIVEVLDYIPFENLLMLHVTCDICDICDKCNTCDMCDTSNTM
jgi:hypothetical protein